MKSLNTVMSFFFLFFPPIKFRNFANVIIFHQSSKAIKYKVLLACLSICVALFIIISTSTGI